MKPANIFITRSGGASGPPIAKLLDFGLAKTAAVDPAKAGYHRGRGDEGAIIGGPAEVGQYRGREGDIIGGVRLQADLSELSTTPPNLTAQGTILGTFQYMAPEQLEGKEADSRTDIFAFGAVLYEMLTGKKAFEGKTQASLISAIMSSDPPPVSILQPVVPPMLDRVVRKCLAKEPDRSRARRPVSNERRCRRWGHVADHDRSELDGRAEEVG